MRDNGILNSVFFTILLHPPCLDGAFGPLGLMSKGDNERLKYCPLNLTCLLSHPCVYVCIVLGACVHIRDCVCVCVCAHCVEAEGGLREDRWLIVCSRLVLSACQRSGKNGYSPLHFIQPC